MEPGRVKGFGQYGLGDAPCAATLGSVTFTYAEAYATKGRPISMSLPLGAETIGDNLTRAFFDNLLPPVTGGPAFA